jgi:hypothetical protein
MTGLAPAAPAASEAMAVMVAPKSGKVITVLVMRPITEGRRGPYDLLDSRENAAARLLKIVRGADRLGVTAAIKQRRY